MDIQKVNLVYFSATDSTKKVLQLMGSVWQQVCKEVNITKLESEQSEYFFAKDEVVYFGVPAFGGRVPAPALERIGKMKGQDTPAILVVTYGNRAYDDVLLELKNLVEQRGFHVIAAVAAVTEHSIMHQIASGRPDTKDQQELLGFSEQIQKKLEACEEIQKEELTVKGNQPYREYNGIPLKPSAGKACSGCGICAAECPVGAISEKNPKETDKETCISCMRCIKVCPQHARGLNKAMVFALGKKLKKLCAERKENELVI